MQLKKILIITYYWPPAGGPGVQRWLKFAKYLPEFGFEPIIYTPSNPSYPILDESLIQELPENLKVIKHKIWEPYQIAETLSRTNKEYKAGKFETQKNQSLFTKLSVFIRGNFFIPDARKFWVNPSYKFLKSYLKDNSVDTIVTSGPPHSLHLIGLKLKQNESKLKWVADFRDPWTGISYHSQLKLTTFAKRKHKQLEKSVLELANLVIATSFTDAETYRELGAKKVEVVTNGFEGNKFSITKGQSRSLGKPFSLVYSGGLEIARNPVSVWEAIHELIQENEDFAKNFVLEFYGNLSSEVKLSLQENGLESFLVEKGYVDHRTSLEGIQHADLLLVTNFPDEKSKGIIPGKIFEYLATRNPILAIGPKDGDVEKILTDTNSGSYFVHGDTVEIKKYISLIYANKMSETLQDQSPNIGKYTRRRLTEQLAHMITKL